VGFAKQRRVLAIVATDRTFELHEQAGAPVWVGKCIFCNRPLSIAASGAPISRVTIEHIWPRNHGGDDRLENLALACGGCNREKGGRHDLKHRRDPRLLEIVEGLRAKRRQRWREPPAALAHHVAWAERAGGAVAGADEDG
jgi:5-methylcytosine-specific restriction endonuclease McrA